MAGKDLAECAEYVNHTARLLCNALRVSGWSHQFGNIMKQTAKSCEGWPRTLQARRDWCGFYRNATWRKHIAKHLKKMTDISVQCLDHFSASFAKWRYETLDTVMSQLLDMREVSQHGMRPELFQHFQDTELITEVLKHCNDGRLWSWMKASYTLIFGPLEDARRWGMVCPCEEHNRDRRERRVKHIKCARNGKRLHQAYKFAKDLEK